MHVLTTSLALLADLWQMAAIQCAVFFIGIFSASIVIRHRLHFLMAFPEWFMGKLVQVIAAKPGYVFLLLFIFIFNSVAMFAYMMTGALLQFLPTAVCFLTGMNIGIAAGRAQVIAAVSRAARRQLRQELDVDHDVDELLPVDEPAEPSPIPPRGMSLTDFYIQTICVILVAALELPAFWFAIAMGTTMSRHWLPLTDQNLGQSILSRLIAYAAVIVPVLAISAAIEAVAVRMSTKEGESPKDGWEA